MRKFGNDSPQFLTFQLDGSDEVFNFPLAASMTIPDLLEMDKGFEAQLGILRKHIGDAVDRMTAGTAGEILRAWADESRNQGASPGES